MVWRIGTALFPANDNKFVATDYVGRFIISCRDGKYQCAN